MPDSYVIDKIMCRSTHDALAENADLFQNYDFIESDRTDGTMTFTSFMGKQGGKKVRVTIIVDTASHKPQYLWVDGKETLGCW